jgi:putative holliday junction resolvase
MTSKPLTRAQTFQGQNVLALDFGTKNVGLATFRPGNDPYPLPYGRLPGQENALLAQAILKVVRDEAVDAVVLGIPRLLDGQETAMTKKVRDFGEVLKLALGTIPLYLQDETLSSYEAEDRMKNSPRYGFKIDKSQLDALAASIILEDFFSE